MARATQRLIIAGIMPIFTSGRQNSASSAASGHR
jgi:hypothetical protein